MTDTRSLMKIVALAILCIAPSALPAAERQSRKTVTDVNELREKFVQTFGKDVELASDEVRETYDAKYWLAVVRPARSGTFIFRHKFESINYGYRYQDHECRITVGEKGSSRTLGYDLRPELFCVGDSVIIPILIGDNIINHTFSRVSRYPQYYHGPFESRLDDRKIDTAAEPRLKYIGREFHYAVHRAYKTASVSFFAFFEAAETGRFNLSLSSRVPDGLQRYLREEFRYIVTSVVIVSREAPVTGLIAEESIFETDEKSDKPRAASLGGRGYPRSVLMLRPGDRISLSYGGMQVPNTDEVQALVKEVEPVISVLPFSVDAKSYYNDWIVDHVLR